MDLSQIISPDDIRNLSYEECEDLADDIRTKIIQTVSKNGGHLSSNLGIVPKAPMTALKPATPLRLFRLRSAWRAPEMPGAKNIM